MRNYVYVGMLGTALAVLIIVVGYWVVMA